MQSRKRIEAVLKERKNEFLAHINSLIGSKLRGHILPEEVLNEVVVYALERPEQWEKRSELDLFYYLQWKAKLLVVDKARKYHSIERIAKVKTNLLRDADSDPGVIPSPTLQIHRMDKKSAVHSFIQQLPDDEYKKALKLVRLEGYSIKDAAREMGKTPDETRSLVKQALTCLFRAAEAMGGSKYITTGETS